MNNTIVHPTDFSKCANDALDYAIKIAKTLDCKINIVHSLDFGGEQNILQNNTSMSEVSDKIERTATMKVALNSLRIAFITSHHDLSFISFTSR